MKNASSHRLAEKLARDLHLTAKPPVAYMSLSVFNRISPEPADAVECEHCGDTLGIWIEGAEWSYLGCDCKEGTE